MGRLLLWGQQILMIRLLLRGSQGFSKEYPKNIDLSTSSSAFKAASMIRQYRKELLPVPDYNNPEALPFGKYHTDHMIHVNWDAKAGWLTPRLQPFRDLNLSPFSSGLHYGIQCYEGTKAYKNQKGEIRLFRPQLNIYRLKRSSKRVTMPDFDGKQLLNMIEELVKLEERWIPPRTEYSLYIRPFHFSIDDALGVKKPDKTKLMVILSPVGPYYTTGFTPVSLFCATEAIRSAPKGTGAYKLGGNYGPTIQATTDVEARGHQQVLWLFEKQITEVGSSNIFFVFKDKNGEIEVTTPEIEDMVLPGITRDSILELLRDQKEYKVTERKLYIDEVIQRSKKGQLLQIFGAGTAVIIGSIRNIEYEGQNYEVPYDKNLNFGKIAYKLRKDLLDIQEGRSQDKFGWVKQLN